MRILHLAPLVALISCTSGSGGATAPAVSGGPMTGIRVTSPAGPDQIMEWGSPTTPNVGAATGGGGIGTPVVAGPVSNPYPNPTTGAVVVRLALSSRAEIRMWLERVEPAGYLAAGARMLVGGVVAGSGSQFVRSLVREGLVLEAGLHDFHLALADVAQPLASGFYRVHIASPTYATWRDIILYRTPGELPGSLRAVVSGW